MSDSNTRIPYPLGRMIHLLMLVALAGLWGVVLTFTWSERESTLNRISDQLATTVITLADFNELAEQAATLGLLQDTDTRTEALWRALLQYPALSLWFESDGVLSAGLPPDSTEDSILVQEDRATFTVFAALPEAEALRDWQQLTNQRVITLFLVTFVFLVLTQFLVRALRLRQVAEAKIAELARIDALTGLANRRTFNERLDQLFTATMRGGNPFAVFYMDLDRFKTINDTLGHAVGDALLVETARRLKSAVRATDLVARLGGDEFAILQTDLKDPASASRLAEHIREHMQVPMLLDGNELQITTSIGICTWSKANKDPDSMLIQADQALYRAKEEGRDRYCFHSPELERQVQVRNLLAEELRLAIEQDQLQVAWQVQLGLVDGRVAGLKALLRWQHPRLGLLEANDFIPVAEKKGTIIALGNWLLTQACRQLRHWRDAGLAPGSIAMNLSLLQIKNASELVQDIASTTKALGLQPTDLEFDVTEAMLAQLTMLQNEALLRLHTLGCKINIDNIGSDFSTFDYIRKHDVRHLKMSSEDFQSALVDADRAAALKAILQMAAELELEVVLEGVETQAHLAFLQVLEKSYSKAGYYYSLPLDGPAASSLLHQGHIKIQS